MNEGELMIKELFEKEYIGTIKLFDESVFDRVFNYLKIQHLELLQLQKLFLIEKKIVREIENY